MGLEKGNGKNDKWLLMGNICKPIPGNMQLLFDSGKIYWGEEIACVTQAQNRSSLVILRIASVSIGLNKTIFPLRIVLAAWLVVPEVLTQTKCSYEHRTTTGECLINQE